MTIYVIMKSTGEYSDRDERPIAYTLTEDEAKAAIQRVTVEAQRGDERPKYPDFESELGWFLPDGSEVSWGLGDPRPEGVKARILPDADERQARNEARRAAYYAALEALGHVDPEGADPEAIYSYEVVELVQPPRCADGA